MRLTIENAKKAGIPVSVCGEVAADPAAAILLMALGIDELSMGAFSIPAVKRIIRSVSTDQATALLDEVMKLDSGVRVEAAVNAWMGENLGEEE